MTISSPGDYIINVGTLEPKKNLVRLIRAYTYLYEYHNVRHKLVIAGKRTWKDEPVMNKALKSPARDNIIFTGYIESPNCLAALIQGATAFVFPSLHEGFGIPPVEAMACGTPVIVSDTTSMPEIAGSAAVLVNPYSIESIAGAIYKVINCQHLRQEMRDAGLENCKRFNYSESAQKMLDIIKN